MNTIAVTFYKTPVGELILGSFNDSLCLCDWHYRSLRMSIDQRIQNGLEAMYLPGISPVIRQAELQLDEYFRRERKTFDIPLLMVGTPFQKKVWNALLQIRYGETDTYLNLSRKLGDEKAIRAVAAANGANALSIIVPCHRIVGSKGQLTGYAGGLSAKRKLLKMEMKGRPGEQLEWLEQADPS